MNYVELLKDQRWQDKRKWILKRDGYACSVCANKSFIEDLSYASSSNCNPTHGQGSRISANIHLYEDNYLFGWIDKEYFTLLMDAKDANPRQTLCVLYEKIDEDKTKFKDYGFFFIEAKKYSQIRQIVRDDRMSEFTWYNIKSLHVHHIFYQDGLMPWEYPNEVLTTLCWKCHENRHKMAKQRWLNKAGLEIGTLTPCHRCNGEGWFPEYKHVQDGICFWCLGAQCEELREDNLSS